MSDTLASRARPDAYALVRTHGRTIAIPSGCITQAVDAPESLSPLPRRSGAIEGVMTLGRRVLPVVGLSRWLDTEAATDERGLVLLLEEEGRCIGLAVEAVIGVQKVAPGQVHRLFHDERPEELFQSAALFGDDTAATVILEPRRLMALADVWVADANLDRGGAVDAVVVKARSGAVPHATFRIGDAHVALPATHVGELLREPRLRKELPRHDGVEGLCVWRGRDVPVVDLAGALHAMTADESAHWVCIVRVGDLAIGIVVHEVLAITGIEPDAGTPDATLEREHAVVARRLVVGEQTLQVIDGAALVRRYPEAAISRAADGKSARADQDDPAGRASAPAYMVFDAGGRYAARIDGVQEVVPLPDALRPRLDAGLSTTLQWRDRPVPVLPIGDSLVALPAQGARQLVIVERDGRFAALTIGSVQALVPRGVAERNRMRMQGRPVEVISVETPDHRASYTVVDLGGGLATERTSARSIMNAISEVPTTT